MARAFLGKKLKMLCYNCNVNRQTYNYAGNSAFLKTTCTLKIVESKMHLTTYCSVSRARCWSSSASPSGLCGPMPGVTWLIFGA